MAFSSLQRSIIYTLAYSHQWRWPLLVSELHNRLLAQVTPDVNTQFQFQTKLISTQMVAKEVGELSKQGLLSISDEKLVSLVGFEDDVENRLTREKIAPTKWDEVSSLLNKVKHISWIEGVFVTGALAVNNVYEDDDVDFMIVTTPGTLWLTRLVVSWIALLAGKRRTWNGFEPNSWCFNLWLTSDELGVFAQRKSLYTAYELLQMKCVYDKGGVETTLKQKNKWMTEYLPQWRDVRARRQGVVGTKQAVANRKPTLKNKFIKIINRLMYQLQYWYMQPHQTREVVSLSHAFFHPRDTQSLVYRGWADVLQSWVGLLNTKH